MLNTKGDGENKHSIKKRRKEIGLTQLEVANAANIAIRAYQNYETGERVPNVHIAQRIAKVLDVENVKEIFPLPQLREIEEKTE